jgi:uncharacterized membrane protein YkoI
VSRWLLALLTTAWLATASGQAGPSRPPARPDGPSLQLAQGGMSLEQATRAALRVFPGRVARAETLERGGRRIHEIRILGEDGRVRSFRFDATSGRAM